MDYLGFNEKAMMNAIIHNGWHPEIKRISLVCEKCRNPFVHLIMEQDLPKSEAWDRVSINVFVCPDCGNREIDIVGTYLFNEFTPGDVLDSIGSYLKLFGFTLEKVKENLLEKKPKKKPRRVKKNAD